MIYVDKRGQSKTEPMKIFDLFKKNINKKADAYFIKEIEESTSGLIIAKTSSKKWGEDFMLMCKSKEQISYAKKCLDYLDNMPDETKCRLGRYLVR